MARKLRLKKLISWTIQGPIVVRLVMHFLAYNVATIFLLMSVWGIRSTMASVAEQPMSQTAPTFWQQTSPLIICMLVMTPFMIWDLIALTNRIAGPLYRFESILRDFGKSGVLKPAVLRNGDLLTNFQKHFNEFAEALHALHPETKPTPQRSEGLQSLSAADGASAGESESRIRLRQSV